MEMEGKEYQVSTQVGNRRKSFWQKQTQKVKGRLEQRPSGMVQGPSEHIQRRIDPGQFLFKCFMVSEYLFPYNFCVEALTSHVAVLGNGTTNKVIKVKGGALIE